MSCKKFEHIGNFQDYWHIIGLSSQLKRKCFFKTKIYGIPIIVWKNSGKIYASLDVCPHMKAPLKVSKKGKGDIRCMYHGWEFDSHGEIVDIPSSPHLVSKMKCKLHMLQVREEDGMIAILLNNESKKEYISLNDIETQKWKSYSTYYNFDTNEELLIENFMDATHTPVVHNKVVRDASNKNEHSIEVSENSKGVLVTFLETSENVGGIISSIFRKGLKISHTDEFILPNIVQVKYYINGIHRFQTNISCHPLCEGKTRALVSIRYNFGILDYLLTPMLPYIAKKVLKQDDDITRLQYKNRLTFHNIKDTPIDYDLIHKRVQIARKIVKNGEKRDIKDTSMNINITV